MLPLSRIISALLVGLGLALMVAGFSAPRFLNGDARFPLDLQNVTWTMHDPNGRVYAESGKDGKEGKTVTTPITHQLYMTVQNPATDERTSLRVGDSLLRGDQKTEFDNLISASTWTYEMDRITGQVPDGAKLSAVMAMPDAQVQLDGVWLKFPTDVQQVSYDVFDPVLRGSAPATFTGESQLDGRTVYTFVQEVEPTNLAKRYMSPFNTASLPGPKEEEPITAYRMYSATRTFTVDQITGVVVGINERVDNYFADLNGRRLRDIFSYDAMMDEQQCSRIAAQLTRVTQSVSQTVTWAVIGLGALLTLGGLIGALRPAGASPVQRDR